MDALTILDMLDQLEEGIVSLRARNHELEHSTSAPTKHKATKKRKPKAKAKASKAVKKVSVAAADGSSEAAKPVVGKRQALGRSILQLRGHSPAVRSNAAGTES